MLIDVGSRPVKISVDECASSVIVRTIGNLGGGDFGAANGLLTTKSTNRGKVTVTTVTPLVGLNKGTLIYQESRLPIAQAVPRAPGEILPDPYEVLTIYQDHFTNTQGMWRLNFIVERHKSNDRLWLITIQEETALTPIVTVAAKDLASKVDALRLAEPTPLQRFVQGHGQRLSAWDRILGETAEDLD
jgi:hypothetical protein